MPELARTASTLVRDHDGEPSVSRTLIDAYATLANGGRSHALVAQLDQLAQREVDKIEHDGVRQNLSAADAELALAAAAQVTGEVARVEPAAAQAIRYLEAYRALSGVRAGNLERRLGWARELRGRKLGGQRLRNP
jgi:hypothetical protein